MERILIEHSNLKHSANSEQVKLFVSWTYNKKDAAQSWKDTKVWETEGTKKYCIAEAF